MKSPTEDVAVAAVVVDAVVYRLAVMQRKRMIQ